MGRFTLYGTGAPPQAIRAQRVAKSLGFDSGWFALGAVFFAFASGVTFALLSI